MLNTVSLFGPIALFFGLTILQVPIAFALGISGIIGLFLTLGFGPTLGMLELIPYSIVSSYTLTTIATFVLMAELATVSGITNKLFDAADCYVRHVKGGLAIATVYANAVFGAISGSSVAAAATMTAIAAPAMEKAGYNKQLTAGVIAIAGTLSILIPPSIVLIVFGIITETSIRRLLLAGIVPGLLTAITYVIVVKSWLRIAPQHAPHMLSKSSMKERWRASRSTWPFLLIVIIVFGALYGGFVTVTEAGAIGAISAFVVWIVGQRLIPEDFDAPSWQGLAHAFRRTLVTTGMIVILLVGAQFFSTFLITTGLARQLSGALLDLTASRIIILAICLGALLIMGMFMSQLEILVLTMPIMFPLLSQLGYDPIWLGIIVTKIIEIGLVSPPVGLNVFIVAGASRGSLSSNHGFVGILPFLVGEIGIILLLLFFPELVTYLPERAA